VWKASTVVKSGDIGDCYTAPVTHNFYALKSYNYVYLFDEISSNFKLKDKAIMAFYNTLRSFPKLVLVALPQLIINLFIIYVKVSGDCHAYGVQDDGINDSYYGQADTNPTNYATFKDSCQKFKAADYGVIINLIITIALVWTSIICILMYPCFRVFIMMSVPVEMDLESYCRYKIDKRVSKILCEVLEKINPELLAQKRAEMNEWSQKDLEVTKSYVDLQAAKSKASDKMKDAKQSIKDKAASYKEKMGLSKSQPSSPKSGSEAGPTFEATTATSGASADPSSPSAGSPVELVSPVPSA